MVRKLYLSLMFVLLGVGVCHAQKDRKLAVYGIGFYNLENLFDTCHDEGKNDYEYLPDGANKWTAMKYEHKLRNMARALSDMGTDVLPKVGCAAIGVSEVENANCLQDLCDQPALKARGFRFVHIEGPDRRGVDCALLYNPRFFQVKDVELVPYVPELKKDENYKTRGFLVVSGTLADDHVTIIVNHLPSRFSGSYYRELGGKQLRAIKERLVKEDPNVKLFIMGDMNDDPMDRSMAVSLGAKRDMDKVEKGELWNPWWNVLKSGDGTLQYQGKWNLFDQIILSQSLLNQKGKKDYSTLKHVKHQIFRRDYLFQQEGKYKGNTLRTHAGGVWLDGYSDHLPTIVYVGKWKN